MRYMLALFLTACATDLPPSGGCATGYDTVCTLAGICSTTAQLCGCGTPYTIKSCLTCQPWGAQPWVPQADSCYDYP